MNKFIRAGFYSPKNAFRIILILFCIVPPCRAAANSSIYFLTLVDQSWQLAHLNFKNGDLQKVPAAGNDTTYVTVTADSLKLLIIDKSRKLSFLDLSTGKKTAIDIGMTGMVDAVSSRDGKTLLFSLSTGGSNDTNHIWLSDITAKKITQLTHMEDMQHNPIWSHDEKFIFFLSGAGGQNHDIWRLDVSNGSLNQLTAGQLYNFDLACSSRDEIAFSSNRSGDYEIWTMDLSGGNVRQLTHSPGMDSQPTWSPDGQHLVFVSNRDDQSALYIMDRNGSTPRRISPDGLICRNPVWGR